MQDADRQDLLAPLDSMIAYLGVLLEEDLSEQESRRFLEVVHGRAVRLRELVDERPG
jgi:hypothetical protein